MFEKMLNTLVESGYGVRAYEVCAREARGRAAEEPENSAALLLIAFAAQRFVDSYDDQPLPVDVANDELAHFKALVQSLDAAIVSADPNVMLSQLNLASAKLMGIA